VVLLKFVIALETTKSMLT